jgi:MarR-like DNA-binding transcriptional regulator SgrR of sgrS sRNA
MRQLSPHYSLLIRTIPTGIPRSPAMLLIVEVSPDQLTYTFHLHRNVLFHDGSPSAADVRRPSSGCATRRAWSAAQALFEDIAAIGRRSMTVIFRLSRPNAAFLTILAGPFNFDRAPLRRSDFPVRNVMGSGPSASSSRSRARIGSAAASSGTS